MSSQVVFTQSAAPAAPSAGLLALYAYSDGNLYIQNPSAVISQLLAMPAGAITVAVSGAVSIAAPVGATALTVNSALAQNGLVVQGSSTATGFTVTAGSANTNFCANFSAETGGQNFLLVYGDGSITLGSPTGTAKGLGTLNMAGALYANNQIVISSTGAVTAQTLTAVTTVSLGSTTSNTVGFYGTTPIAQRTTVTNQHTSLLATMTTTTGSLFDGTNLSTLNQAIVALQEVMNTLQAYGLWGTH